MWLSGVLPRYQPVLHCEESRRSTIRRSALEVGVDGLRRDAQLTGHLLGLQPSCDQPDDLGFSSTRPAARFPGAPAASITAFVISGSNRPSPASLARTSAASSLIIG